MGLDDELPDLRSEVRFEMGSRVGWRMTRGGGGDLGIRL